MKNVNSNSNLVAEYAYNDKGIRYRKKLGNGDIIRYVVDGDRILQEQHNSFVINYLYSLNNLFGFIYNNVTYIYERNIFGDIVRIYNTNGDIVGEYIYDAFGNGTIICDVDGIATLNPFRYRGYVWDQQTKLYYLRSRYYAPDKLRYISADNSVTEIYVYCSNNPTCKRDDSGYSAVYSLEGTRKLHDVVVEKVKAEKDNFGYDALLNQYVDMVKAGIVDPAKVTRSALVNAASIASMLLTTEAAIVEIPEEKPAMPDMSAMQGMGGMM